MNDLDQKFQMMSNDVANVCLKVPAWITNRMSYVDIAWPYGLVTIGTLPWMATAEMFGPRTYMIMTAYLIAGGRMGLGATTFLFKGVLNNEFPRCDENAKKHAFYVLKFIFISIKLIFSNRYLYLRKI